MIWGVIFYTSRGNNAPIETHNIKPHLPECCIPSTCSRNGNQNETTQKLHSHVRTDVDQSFSSSGATKQKNCVILEGGFLWAAAASVVHRVCRAGRESKAEHGKEFLGHQGDLCGVKASSNTESGGSLDRTQGVAGGSRPSSAANSNPPHRPQTKRGNPPPRKGTGGSRSVSTYYSSSVGSSTAATAGGGGVSGTTANHRILRGVGGGRPNGATTGAAGVNERTDNDSEGEGDGQQSGRDEKGAAEQDNQQPKQTKEEENKVEETTTPLSKEAAFLKAAEVTEGGQGAMLFSEFVEALTRLCLTRYGARAAPRAPGSAPSVATSGANGFGVGLRKTNTTLKYLFAARSFAPGRNQNVRGSTAVRLSLRTKPRTSICE